MKSGLEIAQEAVLRPIAEVAADAGIEPDELKPYGSTRAKVALSILDRLADRPDGKLIITTAITPTKAGEGKTTTSVSLTQGLGAIGKRVMLALREPSMGPVFGIKGGGTGGGYAQVVPTTCCRPRWTLRSITATSSTSIRCRSRGRALST
jgi:formate--tetrahydrofolate ligase